MDDIKASGEYRDFERWQINYGTNWGDISHIIATEHEAAHLLIDTTSVYGQITTSYKNIIKDEDNQDYLDWIIGIFQQNSKIPHEVYATYAGISIAKEMHFEINLTELLTPEYIDYFTIAEYITSEIPSLFLKNQILFVTVLSCFQSFNVGKITSEFWGTVTFDKFDALDYPNKRFDVILNNFKPMFLKSQLDECIDNCQDSDMALIYKRAFEENFSKDSIKQEDINKISRIVFEHFYSLFKKYFAKLDSTSYEMDGNIEVVNSIYSRIHSYIGDDSEFENPAVIDNPDVYMLRRYEGEEIVFNRNLKECQIYFPYVFTSEFKNKLLHNTNNPDLSIIYLTAKYSADVLDDYKFIENSDIEWLQNHAKVIIYITLYLKIGEQNLIALVPFSSTIEINDFLDDLKFNTNINTLVNQRAFAYTDFTESLLDDLLELSNNYCFLMEAAPYLMIENRFYIKSKSISYCEFAIKVNSIFTYIGLVFEVIDIEENRLLWILPASEVHTAVLYEYLEKHTEFIPTQQIKLIDYSDRMMLTIFLNNLYSTHSFKLYNY